MNKVTPAPNSISKIVVKIPSEDYARLRVKLMQRGSTVSHWVRILVYRFLDGEVKK